MNFVLFFSSLKWTAKGSSKDFSLRLYYIQGDLTHRSQETPLESQMLSGQEGSWMSLSGVYRIIPLHTGAGDVRGSCGLLSLSLVGCRAWDLWAPCWHHQLDRKTFTSAGFHYLFTLRFLLFTPSGESLFLHTTYWNGLEVLHNSICDFRPHKQYLNILELSKLRCGTKGKCQFWAFHCKQLIKHFSLKCRISFLKVIFSIYSCALGV